MPAPNTSDYLKLINVQLAAEALYGKLPGRGFRPGEKYSGPIEADVLTTGNQYSSKFNLSQAAEFASVIGDRPQLFSIDGLPREYSHSI